MNKCKYLLLLGCYALVAVEGKGQKRMETSAEGNEIPYDRLSKDNEDHEVKKQQNSEHKTASSIKGNLTSKVEVSNLGCPHKDAPRPLFTLPCSSNGHCSFLGKGMKCCDGNCLKGIAIEKENPHHAPAFFGIVQRKCSTDPLTEFSEVKECTTDDECSPRICCPETLPNGKKAKYCRTSIPVWDTLPLPSPVVEPIKTVTTYIQCTPPPPSHLDLHPKSCQSPMDCFPNLCCQEMGKKVCRPPKRSLLALFAELGQKFWINRPLQKNVKLYEMVTKCLGEEEQILILKLIDYFQREKVARKILLPVDTVFKRIFPEDAARKLIERIS